MTKVFTTSPDTPCEICGKPGGPINSNGSGMVVCEEHFDAYFDALERSDMSDE